MCTDSNLLECLNVILALRDRSSVTVSYIDFAKAFDSVRLLATENFATGHQYMILVAIYIVC